MLKEKHQKIIVLTSIVFFLFWKFSLLTFRFGDSNAYFYMASHFFEGLLPYRDYFLADPPAMIILLALIKSLTGKHLIFLQATPFLFEASGAWLIYQILKKENCHFSFLAPAIYLFSFSVLATSDFVTGVQLVNFFSMLAIFFFQKKSFKLSGFFWAIAILTKLYAVFLFLGFILFLFIKKNFSLLLALFVGFVSAILIILLPFFYLAPSAVFTDLVLHHFHRPAGNSALTVFSFFFQKEWLLILLAFSGLFFSKKWLFGASFLALFIFLLFFQDLYYTYFGALIPFLAILAIFFVEFLFQNPNWRGILVVIGGFYLFFLIFGAKTYQDQHLPFGQFSNAPEIAAYFDKLDDSENIYGSHEVAPLVALLANKKLLNNYIDTNPQTFGSGAQKKGLDQPSRDRKKSLFNWKSFLSTGNQPFCQWNRRLFFRKAFSRKMPPHQRISQFFKRMGQPDCCLSMFLTI